MSTQASRSIVCAIASLTSAGLAAFAALGNMETGLPVDLAQTTASTTSTLRSFLPVSIEPFDRVAPDPYGGGPRSIEADGICDGWRAHAATRSAIDVLARYGAVGVASVVSDVRLTESLRVNGDASLGLWLGDELILACGDLADNDLSRGVAQAVHDMMGQQIDGLAISGASFRNDDRLESWLPTWAARPGGGRYVPAVLGPVRRMPMTDREVDGFAMSGHLSWEGRDQFIADLGDVLFAVLGGAGGSTRPMVGPLRTKADLVAELFDIAHPELGAAFSDALEHGSPKREVITPPILRAQGARPLTWAAEIDQSTHIWSRAHGRWQAAGKLWDNPVMGEANHDASDAERFEAIAHEALGKYPVTLVREVAPKVVGCLRLWTEGAPADKIPWVALDKGVAVSGLDSRHGPPRQLLERRIHAAVASKLLERAGAPTDTEWRSVGGMWDAAPARPGDERKDRWYIERQFIPALMPEGQLSWALFTTPRMQQIELLSLLFEASPRLWILIDAHPRLAAKVKMLTNFTATLDPRLDEDYFRGLAAAKLK